MTPSRPNDPLRRRLLAASAGAVFARTAFARHTISELIELLASEELRVRFFAEMALRDATNT